MGERHTCHACHCSAPCPPEHLMCRACWSAVSAKSRARLSRELRHQPGVPGRVAVRWLGAVCYARADVAAARGDAATAAAQRKRGAGFFGTAPVFAGEVCDG